MAIEFELNGEIVHYHGDPRASLLNALRETYWLTGAKVVCEEGFCGACTVHVDGEAVPSCLRPIGLIANCSVTTIEGLAEPEAPHRLQTAFREHDVVQCGMCFPGMVMSLSKLLEDNPTPTREEVKHGLVGNICRCTGYERIVDAVMSLQDNSEARA
ncbi:MAG: (2Fe-2S)-binding protein [Rhizobiaceae bacterium MnEN-MB40S]|nr:MAG: (2Fe-2S)-binding protein [Rhizobiaceae bacterium MnEN-MB40S]